MMTPMKWFYSFLKKYRFRMILGLIMTTMIAALSIVNPQIAGIIVDEVITQGQTDRLIPLVMLFV